MSKRLGYAEVHLQAAEGAGAEPHLIDALKQVIEHLKELPPSPPENKKVFKVTVTHPERMPLLDVESFSKGLNERGYFNMDLKWDVEELDG